MKKKYRKGLLGLLAAVMLVGVNTIPAQAAFCGTVKSVSSDYDTVKALLRNQSHSLKTAEQIESDYDYFMRQSAWRPGGTAFPYTNSGSYKSSISDGQKSFKCSSAKGCMLYSNFVSGVVYGKDRNVKTASVTKTADVKNLIIKQAQFGEHIRIDNKHSITFLAAEDNGFYGLEYWEGQPIQFVYYTYARLVSKAGGSKIWIYNIDTVENSGNTSVDQQAPEISQIYVSDISYSGYTVTCKVTDNVGVDRVQFPTWTTTNGQDDIDPDWWTGMGSRGTYIGNDQYSFRVETSAHNGEMLDYETHIYAFDKAGNYTSKAIGHYGTLLGCVQDVGAEAYVKISNAATGTALTAESDGNVVARTFTGNANQIWRMVRNNDWSYTVYSYEIPGKCLDVSAASDANGTNVQIYDHFTEDNAAQKWRLYLQQDGYMMLPVCSNSKCLDLNSGSAVEGTNVQIWQYAGGRPSIFKIETVNPADYVNASKTEEKADDSQNKTGTEQPSEQPTVTAPEETETVPTPEEPKAIQDNESVQDSTEKTAKQSPLKHLKDALTKQVKQKSIKVQWKKKRGAKGYQVQIASDKKFKKNKKSATVRTNTKKFTNMKKGTYYVRVRVITYKNGKKVYGRWSKVKKLQIR